MEQKNLELNYNNQCLYIHGKDCPFKSIPLNHIQQIVCMHGVALTSQLLGQLSRRSIQYQWQQSLSQRRPPPDPVNSLLSLTFTLVYQQAIRQCKLRGLDSQLGFYHRPLDGRHSLACDLMEPLRPLIEEWVVGIFQQGLLDKRHFTQTTEGCLLGKKGKDIYYLQLAEKERGWQRTLDAYSRWLMRLIDMARA